MRLERDGVLVSFAVPRGLPRDRNRNNLAKHTEDHPLEYLDFAGEIPAGEYGGGRMTIHDTGTYETDKWRADEISVTFHGDRTSGRYVFFQTGGNDWMVRRMDPPEPGWEPMPEAVEPMLGDRGRRLAAARPRLGVRDELGRPPHPRVRVRWPGPARRPTAPTSPPGTRRSARSATRSPRSRRCSTARSSRSTAPGSRRTLLARRKEPRDAAAARRAAERTPVQFLAFDLLWLEGHATVEAVRYAERRELLDGLSLAGDHWQTPPYFPGGGEFALEAAAAQGLPGVVAKRLDSPYLPGRRSRLWLRVDIRRVTPLND